MTTTGLSASLAPSLRLVLSLMPSLRIKTPTLIESYDLFTESLPTMESLSRVSSMLDSSLDTIHELISIEADLIASTRIDPRRSAFCGFCKDDQPSKFKS